MNNPSTLGYSFLEDFVVPTKKLSNKLHFDVLETVMPDFNQKGEVHYKKQKLGLVHINEMGTRSVSEFEWKVYPQSNSENTDLGSDTVYSGTVSDTNVSSFTFPIEETTDYFVIIQPIFTRSTKKYTEFKAVPLIPSPDQRTMASVPEKPESTRNTATNKSLGIALDRQMKEPTPPPSTTTSEKIFKIFYTSKIIASKLERERNFNEQERAVIPPPKSLREMLLQKNEIIRQNDKNFEETLRELRNEEKELISNQIKKDSESIRRRIKIVPYPSLSSVCSSSFEPTKNHVKFDVPRQVRLSSSNEGSPEREESDDELNQAIQELNEIANGEW